MGKALLVVGVILALLGLVHLLMPQVLPNLGFSTIMQQVVGIVLLVIGVVLILKKK